MQSGKRMQWTRINSFGFVSESGSGLKGVLPSKAGCMSTIGPLAYFGGLFAVQPSISDQPTTVAATGTVFLENGVVESTKNGHVFVSTETANRFADTATIHWPSCTARTGIHGIVWVLDH